MDYGKDTVDSWTSTDDDDDFCYVCDDWAEDDGHGNCKECGVAFKTVDPFISPSTAKVYSSPAPSISAHGDVWGRGGGSSYTWGGHTSWWGGSGSYTSQWGGGWSSSNTDREARMLKHKRHLDSLCKVVDPNVKHVLGFSTDKNYSDMNIALRDQWCEKLQRKMSFRFLLIISRHSKTQQWTLRLMVILKILGHGIILT